MSQRSPIQRSCSAKLTRYCVGFACLLQSYPIIIILNLRDDRIRKRMINGRTSKWLQMAFFNGKCSLPINYYHKHFSIYIRISVIYFIVKYLDAIDICCYNANKLLVGCIITINARISSFCKANLQLRTCTTLNVMYITYKKIVSITCKCNKLRLQHRYWVNRINYFK